MIRDDYFDDYRNIPDYYDYMYLDGFEPWQIQQAVNKRNQRMFREWLAMQEKLKRAKTDPNFKPPTEEEYMINLMNSMRIKR